MTKQVVVGEKALKYKLLGLAKKYDQKDDVVVGFTQNYAIHVHENLHSAHKVGQAKYLETAYKMILPEIKGIVKAILKVGGSLTKGLLIAGLRIQREAQKLTPVDTGALKASAYTARERNSTAAILRAKGRGWEKMEQVKWMRD
jgi:hypothetical protein